MTSHMYHEAITKGGLELDALGAYKAAWEDVESALGEVKASDVWRAYIEAWQAYDAAKPGGASLYAWEAYEVAKAAVEASKEWKAYEKALQAGKQATAPLWGGRSSEDITKGEL